MPRRRRSVVAAVVTLIVAGLGYLLMPPGNLSADGVIVSVADGDTLVITVEGRKEHVRLIGVDTPETGHSPRLDSMAAHSGRSKADIAALGEKSKEFVAGLCGGATHVRVEFDPANAPSNRDKYERLLAYVYLTPKGGAGEVMLNAEIVRQGYGRAYTTYRFKYSKAFRAYEQDAKSDQRGLWKEGALP
jgi:micrococcal nuclease